MPFPVAHGLLGASVAAASGRDLYSAGDRKVMLVAAIVAVVPDGDFVLSWGLHLGPGWHRGFSHSIAFAGGIAIVACLLTYRLNFKGFAVYWLAAVTHGLLDSFTSKWAPGAELLWPVVRQRIAAGLFDYLDFDLKRSPLKGFILGSVKISLIELAIFGPIFLLVCFTVRLLKQRATARAGMPSKQTV
jgi:membrane-bound metal-dependent hydrolase YbcI (DUF457 family)